MKKLERLTYLGHRKALLVYKHIHQLLTLQGRRQLDMVDIDADAIGTDGATAGITRAL